MLNNNGLATTWIESFILKGNSKDKFSILTSTFTIMRCYPAVQIPRHYNLQYFINYICKN